MHRRSDDSLRLRVGLRAAYPYLVRTGFAVVPSVHVGYARELLDNTRPIRSTLNGYNATFTVNGDEGSKNIVTFGGMLKAEWSQGITLYAGYDGEWAGDRQVHSGKIGLQIRW